MSANTLTPSSSPSRRIPKEWWIFGVLLLVVLLFETLGWLLVGQSFTFNTQRILVIVLQVSIVGIMAVGVTQIIIMAGIDLSGGSILGFAGMVAATLAQSSASGRAFFPALVDLPVIVPILAGISVGVVLGFINGAIISATAIPPFIMTLGMLVIARGLARWYTSGAQVSFFVEDFAILGRGTTPIIIFALTAILFHILLSHTLYGRRTYAIGSNEEAARTSGINVASHKTLVYTIAGGLYGLAAVVQTSRAETAQSGTGLYWELDAISAAVIGGTSLFGGVGRIVGTVIGVLILGVMTSGFTFLGISPFYVNIVKGVIIVLAVVIDRYRTKRPS